MERFGCCSSYVDCSDKRVCLHIGDSDYEGCSYRGNLESGKIFYGVNATAIDTPKTEAQEMLIEDKVIFLYCFNRVFSIRSRLKNGFSMELTPEQANKIEIAFNNAFIPYKLQIDSMAECIIDKPTEEDPAPANSRVVFEIDGEEFHVLNYNDWLIKRKNAELIAKAFDNNFIKARVELRGSFSNVNKVNVLPDWIAKAEKAFQDTDKKPQEVQKPAVQLEPSTAEDLTVYTQESIFKMQQVPEVNIGSQLIVGQPVIAFDEYWGTYTGELVEVYTTRYTKERKANVKILENLVYPSQYAIMYKDCIYRREPYPKGSIQTFDLCNVEQSVNRLSVIIFPLFIFFEEEVPINVG